MLARDLRNATRSLQKTLRSAMKMLFFIDILETDDDEALKLRMADFDNLLCIFLVC